MRLSFLSCSVSWFWHRFRNMIFSEQTSMCFFSFFDLQYFSPNHLVWVQWTSGDQVFYQRRLCRNIANIFVLYVIIDFDIISVRFNIFKISYLVFLSFRLSCSLVTCSPEENWRPLLWLKRSKMDLKNIFLYRWHIVDDIYWKKPSLLLLFLDWYIGRLGVIPPIHPFCLQALLKKVFKMKRHLRNDKNNNDFACLIMDW